MLLIDSLLDVIAPHECVQCGKEGSLLCESCSIEACSSLPSRCYRCKKLTLDFAVCQSCRKTSKLGHVWARTDYKDVSKQLIYKLKFKSARGGAKIIANLMYEVIPFFDANTLIVHIPTANGRRRQRGFDHAELIARELSKISGLPHKKLLGRIGSARQVGSSRQERLKQLTDAFYVMDSVSPDTRVLLVDDIVTTGGTLEATASMLKDSGIKKVDALVLAQK